MKTPFPTLSLDDFRKDAKSFSKNLGNSFHQWGFCGIQGHGIDTQLVKDTQELFHIFFGYTEEKKQTYFKSTLHGARGYTPFKIETPKDANFADLKEFWHVGRELDAADRYKKWMPDNVDIPDIKGFKEITNNLFLQFDQLGNTLLEAIALYLEQDSTYFHNITNKGNSVMRVIHYPPIEEKEAGERAGPHEDINLITLLIGGQQAGLEILSSDNKWLRASVEDDVIICNVGDMLQRLTNHFLVSTTHRVTATPEEMKTSRYSIPFFVHPNPDWFIQTLSTTIDDNNPNRYPEGIYAEEFLQERLKEIKLM